ncbi:hypothetical protein [Hydrogenophaga sp.]|uniref:hypothetical protein n=1 Tax=Hydrogenophaga sp. TaxID=1904254 RepID=UPI0027303FEB|nr:hypothetical protein [Hydrogenophaga sp.]MDP1686860.1 hypothetical protein [Hydrogenophaga sp.]
MSPRQNWLAGVLASALFLVLGAGLDAAPHEAQDVADTTTEAVTMAELETRRDALALRICQAELGPGTAVLWTVDGDLVCRPAVLTAQGGAQ